MVLDVGKYTLSYRINDNDIRVIFDDVILWEETYMVITIGKQGLSVELLSYWCRNTSS